LQQALQFRHPLSRWIIDTSITKSSSHPYSALSIFFDPIRREFSKQDGDITLIFQRLSILASRYESKIVRATDVDWHNPFSTEHSFFDAIHRPRDLAKSITKHVSTLFTTLICNISITDILNNTNYTREIGVHWTTLSEETTACANANKDLIPWLLILAEVRWRLRT
jgi:hypothetical protein